MNDPARIIFTVAILIIFAYCMTGPWRNEEKWNQRMNLKLRAFALWLRY
jgi:hypothetical protein